MHFAANDGSARTEEGRRAEIDVEIFSLERPGGRQLHLITGAHGPAALCEVLRRRCKWRSRLIAREAEIRPGAAAGEVQQAAAPQRDANAAAYGRQPVLLETGS